MRIRAGPTIVATCLLLGATWGLAHREATAVPLRDAPDHEGGPPIRTSGLALDVRPQRARPSSSETSRTTGPDAGGPVAEPNVPTRFTLHDGGTSLAVLAPAPVTEGSFVTIEGRVSRIAGTLTLVALVPDDVQAIPPPEFQPTWDDLAHDPGAWLARPVTLRGTLANGALRDGTSHRLQLQPGAWPATGTGHAHGYLLYDPACFCHRLHPGTANPWTT